MQSIYDNFREWSKYDVFIREIDGVTLYAELLDDRKRHDKGECKITWGSHYYREKK